MFDVFLWWNSTNSFADVLGRCRPSSVEEDECTTTSTTSSSADVFLWPLAWPDGVISGGPEGKLPAPCRRRATTCKKQVAAAAGSTDHDDLCGRFPLRVLHRPRARWHERPGPCTVAPAQDVLERVCVEQLCLLGHWRGVLTSAPSLPCESSLLERNPDRAGPMDLARRHLVCV